MKLDLNFKIKDFAGNEISEDNIAKILANALAANRSKDPVKMMHIALELYTKGYVELDKSDLQKLSEEIKKHEGFTDIFKAAVLEVIDKLK